VFLIPCVLIYYSPLNSKPFRSLLPRPPASSSVSLIFRVFLLAQSHIHIDKSVDSKYHARILFIFNGWVQSSNPPAGNYLPGYWPMNVETHLDTEVMEVATMMLGWMK
jgi:hypothetical protein